MGVSFTGVRFEPGFNATRIAKVFSVPWTETDILGAFEDYQPAAKDEQALFSLARYTEGARRGNAGIIVNTGVLLDKDCGNLDDIDPVLDHLRVLGLAYFWYTSWSHGRADKMHPDTGRQGPFACYRIAVPYSREVTPDEHRVLVPALFGYEVPPDPPEYAAEVLGRFVTTPAGRERAARPRGWDVVSSRPAQGFYSPSPSALVEVNEGDPIDVDTVLRRPHTARVTARHSRPYQLPSAEAAGALGALDEALRKYGFGLGSPAHEGWRRSTCPSCQDPSPSLRARANADGIDLHCFASCARRDILAAVGLEDGAIYKPPSDLKVALEEQLAAQVPPDLAVPVDEAVVRLVDDIRAALDAREPTVIKYPAGTGKSHASAIVITEQVRAGERVIYSTQEHVVAHETRMKLPADVRARSVHIHSPLIQVGHEAACARREELSEAVFHFGASLLGSFCPRCPIKHQCEAFSAAQARAKAVKDASVVFVSHAGIGQVVGPDKGHDCRLIVDEMPGAFVSLEVDHKTLAELPEARMSSATATTGAIVRELARAWAAGETPGEVVFGDQVIGNALELAAEHRRLTLRERAKPTPAERRWLKAADAVMRMAAWEVEGGRVNRDRNGVWTMLPDKAHEALTQHAGVLLSATPLMPALPGFRLRECEVTDGAPVRRVIVLRGSRGSRALTGAFYDDETGRRVVRERDPGEAPGVPWPAVDEALIRACREAYQYDAKRVLFVTFKAIADVLRAQDPFERVAHAFANRESRIEIEVAHFGALRGKNDWMEGQPKECSVVYCFGTPRFAVLPTLVQLGLTGEAADQAWVAYAAGELAQAEGRLRLPRRTKPCTVMVEGDVAPSTWHPDLVNEVVEVPEDERPPSALLEGALLYRDLDTVIGKPIFPNEPLAYTEDLESLAYPSISEAMRLFASMSPGRWRALHVDFSWVPNEGT